MVLVGSFQSVEIINTKTFVALNKKIKNNENIEYLKYTLNTRFSN